MLSNNKKKFFFVFGVYKLTIIANWCKIWSYFYDIMLILSKIHQFCIFQFFFHPNDGINFGNNRWKKFWSILSIRWDLGQKNPKKNYSLCNDNLCTIRKPMSNLVDLFCFQKFYTIIWVKKIQN
jgi:hypothetical protein